MSTQEVVDWAKECHPNISVHAYDSTYKKFMKHIATTSHHDITLVFFIKNNHCYPITNERLKVLATKANQGGVDNLWKFMTDMKWSRRHEQEEEPLDVSNKVIVLPEDEKSEPVIDRYIYRTNYFVEYLHFRLDGFIDHRSNMFVLNDQYETRRRICDSLFDKFKTADFGLSNQSYTNMATSLFKQTCRYLPESCYDTKTQQVLDDFYPKALQWCSTGDKPDNLVSLDIWKCYPSLLINNKEPIPLYTIHDIIEPFTHNHQLKYYGEFYIDEFIIKQFGADIKIEAGFFCRQLIKHLVNTARMPVSNIKWFITVRQTLKPDTFTKFLTFTFDHDFQKHKQNVLLMVLSQV